MNTGQQPTTAWARATLTSFGRPPTGPPTVISDQAWSTVWRVPTAETAAIIKQSLPARQREADIVTFVAQLAPDQVHAPLAADTANGRMILDDEGPTLYATDHQTRGLDFDTVRALMADYARLQQATIGHGNAAAAASLPTWDPSQAGRRAQQQAMSLYEQPNDDPRHITGDQLARFLDHLPQIERAGRQVADSPIPHCLDHGDLWPGNILPNQARDRFRYIDFGDAMWTHPFLSLTMMVVECRYRWSVPDNPDGLNLDHPILHRILDSYLEAWADYATVSELRETLRNALRIAPLLRSCAWSTNLAQADDQTLENRGTMPWAWLEDLSRPVLL